MAGGFDQPLCRAVGPERAENLAPAVRQQAVQFCQQVIAGLIQRRISGEEFAELFNFNVKAGVAQFNGQNTQFVPNVTAGGILSGIETGDTGGSEQPFGPILISFCPYVGLRFNAPVNNPGGQSQSFAGGPPVGVPCKIWNVWMPNLLINAEHGPAVATPVEPGWLSARWLVLPVGNNPIFRIQNVWRQGECLHIQNGPIELGTVPPEWQSAWWTIEPVGNGPFRLRNFWRKDVFLHVQQQFLAAGPILEGWVSAMWNFAAENPNIPTFQNPNPLHF